MRLVRYGELGAETPAILDENGVIRDASTLVPDWVGKFLDPTTLNHLESTVDLAALPVVDPAVRLGAPISGVGKFLGIGLNYADHAKETGMEPPAEPIVFHKALSAICGPNDDLEIPRGATHTDWEAEVAVVIGKRAKYVSESDAHQHIAGYMGCIDVSERAFQLRRCGQFTKGKSHDGFGSLGPFMAMPRDVTDVHNVALKLSVDGVTRQDGSSSSMIFQIPFLVSYLSQFMTLLPGDVITTGTPPGVGAGIKPTPVFLTADQTIVMEIGELGTQTRRTVPANM
ncbi:MAG: fumarylacetoacetate hydrolase family protein [Alphaproteobacteria bacterium]|nr:fumarylacetoacetate hydrolase family protein [Alphaproteobacteria bacterium]